MENLLVNETLLVVLILVATLVSVVARRIRLPYTVALVLVGLVITVWRPLDIELTPELILSLFVPPLIFEAAFHVDLRLLRSTLPSILMLAVPGVLLTTFFVGAIVALGTGLPFATAIVFGALIAATDPVAVVALFRELGVPRRLAVAVEGESLFNDGHVSGVLAVVVAGLLAGNLGVTSTSPVTKSMIFNLWEYLAFIANSLVFLLIGLDIDLPQLWSNLGSIAVAVVAVLLSRAAVVYGLSWLISLSGSRARVPPSWRHVLFWGGLRGAISLALALSLPANLPHREILQAMSFGVVLFTLLGQGTTIKLLLKRLGLIERPEHVLERERHLGRLLAIQGGLRRLERLHRDGVLIDEIWEGLRDDYAHTRNTLGGEIHRLFAEHAELERELLLQARREALQAEHGALIDALRQGLLSEKIFSELRADIERRLEALALIQASVQSRRQPPAGG
ncbi:MAG: hypothetical protein B6I34_10375 [Anaerolineaceae bacterium 4572_32.1]|nr:MAG: hypothetical protein B6I34_10375 [Anaerolineaceae bacterium 4572_32.1]